MELTILDELGIDETTLSNYQISLVRATQKKINAKMKQMDRKIDRLIEKLYGKGIGASSVYDVEVERLNVDFSEEEEQLKDDLLFQLDYLGTSGEESDEEYSYPDNPDYSLSAADRYRVVKDYYMSMSDPDIRFALFQADTLAPDYLGSFYATLYELLRSYTAS